jgi:hypothetical protein
MYCKNAQKFHRKSKTLCEEIDSKGKNNQNQIFKSIWNFVFKYLAKALTDCKMHYMNYVIITLFIDAVKMQTLQSFFNKKTLS